MSDLKSRSLEILTLLGSHHNVLITGPPATGKTLLLSEIERTFEGIPTGPPHIKGAPVPIPREALPSNLPWLPGPPEARRKVFRTVFHQNSKYRDFVSGLMPDMETPGKFKVSEGVLLQANDFASQADSAALLVIDELNRGPAVQLFGGAIVSMEHDKRGNSLGGHSYDSVGFDALRIEGVKEVFLSSDLYILAVMNQADTSVEALDVAFLRRWEGYKLQPSVEVLLDYLKIVAPPEKFPDEPASPSDVYAMATAAWIAVNKRIKVGRGAEYQLGHGVFMAELPAETIDQALSHISRAWTKLLAHVEEVFFGDPRGVATVLNLFEGNNPCATFSTVMFAEQARDVVWSPSPVPPELIYEYLKAVAGRDAT